MLRVVFIGCGRVGATLAATLMSLGHQVLCGLAQDVDSASAKQFASVTGLMVLPMASDEAVNQARMADVIFITTPDKAVTKVAQTLASQAMVHEGQIVVHTSGAQGSEILAPVTHLGAFALSLHPLQTIASPDAGRAVLEGIYCTLEGHPEAVEAGMRLVRSWGGIAVTIRPDERPAYHAAAVLASNALVALASVASELSGIEDGLQALLPLIKGAVRNLETMGLPDALTGPIERGDLSTVQAHITALQSNPTAQSVYTALGRATADVALRKGTLSPSMWQSFITLFNEFA